MDRRSFLKTTGAAAGAVAVGGSGLGSEALALAATEPAHPAAELPQPAVCRGMKALQLALPWSIELPGYGTTTRRLADRIAAMSEGRLRLEIPDAAFADHTAPAASSPIPAETAWPGSTIDPLAEVKAGRAQICHTIAHLGSAGHRAMGFFSAVPFGLGPRELAAWIGAGGGQRLWDELAGEHDGIKPLLAGIVSGPMGLWQAAVLDAPEDFRNATVASAGFALGLASALGAQVHEDTPRRRSVITANGVRNGEGHGPMADLMLGLPETARVYQPMGLGNAGLLLMLGIARETWDAFSASDQALIEAAAAAASASAEAETLAHRAIALEVMQSRHGIRIVPPSPGLLEAMSVAAGEVIEAVGASDAPSARILASYRAFERQAAPIDRLPPPAMFVS